MFPEFVITLNGQELHLKPNMRDIVAYEETASRRGWGAVDDPARQTTASLFVIFKCAQRTGVYTGDWDEFLDSVENFAPVSTDPIEGHSEA